MIDKAKVERLSKGKLVVIGWDIDRIMGIFSTVDKALEALEKSPDKADHNWWMEFRKLDRWEKSNIFERILLRWEQDAAVT